MEIFQLIQKSKKRSTSEKYRYVQESDTLSDTAIERFGSDNFLWQQRAYVV